MIFRWNRFKDFKLSFTKYLQNYNISLGSIIKCRINFNYIMLSLLLSLLIDINLREDVT